MTEPRTIVYVGNFTKPWCTEVHVAGSLEALGHRVVRCQENETRWPELPELADAEGAHMLLWTRTWPAEMAEVVPVLRELENRGVPSVSYHLDRWFGLDREHQVEDQPFFHTSLVVSPDDSPRWAEHGVNHLWMPPGVYAPECEPVDPDPRRFPHDVVFVGSYPYPHPEWADYRRGLIETMQKRFGRRFGIWPRRRQPLRGRDLQTLYATAKVVVGDSCLAGESHRYWSDRIPETLGRGGLLIHPEVRCSCHGVSIGDDGEWYGDHLLTYPVGEFDEAVNLADEALGLAGDLSDALREGGRGLVLGRDTYEHRMAVLLEHVAYRWRWRTPPTMRTVVNSAGEVCNSFPAEDPEAIMVPPQAVGRPSERFKLGRWAATFTPRDVDVDEHGVFRVADEVWRANDYGIDTRRGLSGTVLDVGANIGCFTVLAAKAGAAKVVAVEPHPENRQRLEAHVAANGVGSKVEVDERAVVGNTVYRPRVEMIGTGGGAYTTAGGHATRTIEAVGLAALLKEHAPVALLKVDIEGGEYDAFDGVTAHLLAESVERIAMEFHGPHMPHLAHLGPEDEHVERWSQLVAMLADCGTVETHGHPRVGGIIHWTRYGAAR